MLVSEMARYLRKNKVNVPEDPEQRVNLFLKQLSKDRYNVRENDVTFKYLVGASTIIAHLLPRIQQPERLLSNFIKAFSERGHCIYNHEPPVSALGRLFAEAKKTSRGKRIISKAIAHENWYMREHSLEVLRNHPELVAKERKKILMAVNDNDTIEMKNAGILALGAHPKVARENYPLINEFITHPGTDYYYIPVIGRSPILVKQHEDTLRNKIRSVSELGIISLKALFSAPELMKEREHEMVREILRDGTNSERQQIVDGLVKNAGLLNRFSKEVGDLRMDPTAAEHLKDSVIHAAGINRDIAERYGEDILNAAKKSRSEWKRICSIHAIGNNPEMAIKNSGFLVNILDSDIGLGIKNAAAKAIAQNPEIIVRHHELLRDLLLKLPAHSKGAILQALAGNPELFAKIVKEQPAALLQNMHLIDLNGVIGALEEVRKKKGMKKQANRALALVRSEALKI